MRGPKDLTPASLDDLGFYAALGLRCGLEVHRQLATERKLFCACPVRPYSPSYDAEILRHMRPTLSELGEYDPTALMEFKTRKQIVYRLNRETVCTYEMDDAPPFGLNRDALERALVVAVMLNLHLVDEIHIARKQYLDGSIPTGFQRTCILGVGGYITVRGRKVGIRQLGLEEEACREVSDIGHTRTFMTDRLSIPLIEVVTEAEARTPAEAADFARVIRRVCHLSGVVRTGLGTVRQDVNVSIHGGCRVEIKGVPRIRQIAPLVHFEALRQEALLRVRDAAMQRGLRPDAFDKDADVTAEVRRGDHPVFTQAIAEGGRARAILLRGCAGLLSFPLGPTRTLASEVSDRVRVIACLDRMPNIAVCDPPNVAPAAATMLTQGVFEAVRAKVGALDGDAVVVMAGPRQDLATAVEEVRIRMCEVLVGVPRETRRALPNGETAFERVLPGPDRMYPDTDLPPVVLHEQDFERARVRAPAPLEEVEARWQGLGLSRAQVDSLLFSDRFRLFEEALPRVRLRPTILAYLVTDYLTGLGREGLDVEGVDTDLLETLYGDHQAATLTQKEAAAMLRKALWGGRRRP